MTGLGETAEEVKQLLRDLSDAGCSIVTVGQYLAPSPAHHPVARFWTDSDYDDVKRYGETLPGIRYVLAGPLVRSSYQARAAYRAAAGARGSQ